MKNLFNAKNKKKIILLGIVFIVLILLLITIFIFSNKQNLLSDNLNLKCELVKTDDPNVYIADNFYVEYKSNDTYAFLGLTKSVEEVSIPNTINKIPVTSARFVSYLDLENYNKERAKRGDPRKVKKIFIPDNVTFINVDNCEQLQEVSISENNDNFYNNMNYCLIVKKSTLLRDKGALLWARSWDDIPKDNTISSIGNGVFEGCRLQSIEIPESVKSIGDSAFINSFIENVTLPNDLKKIGTGAFANNYYLKSITIPKGVEYIGDYAFYMCESLESVTIEEGVKTIGKSAFEHCESLKEMILPRSVEYIKADAFYYCSALEKLEFYDTVIFGSGKSCEGDARIAARCGNLKRIVYRGEKHDLFRWLVQSLFVGSDSREWLLDGSKHYDYKGLYKYVIMQCNDETFYLNKYFPSI